MKQTGAVIAAAGLSSRMGDFKPLLPFGKECVARHLTQMLARTGVSPVVMVTGYRGEELKQQLRIRILYLSKIGSMLLRKCSIR